MKKSDLRRIIKEELKKINEESQIEHSRMRLRNIVQKYTSRQKQDQFANLRTDKIKNIEKLKSWIEALKAEGWFDSVKYATKRLGTI